MPVAGFFSPDQQVADVAAAAANARPTRVEKAGPLGFGQAGDGLGPADATARPSTPCI
jgi:hypothetical protein